MSYTSKTCKNKRGKFKKEYYSFEEAKNAAELVSKSKCNDRTFEAYECSECFKYHIRPERKFPKPFKCGHCTSSDGEKKNLYTSKENAEFALKERESSSGKKLYIYECPHQDGYHISKQTGY